MRSTLFIILVMSVFTVSAQTVPMCENKVVTVDMHKGQTPDPTSLEDQVIRGTLGNDNITGGFGNDTICGRAGEDVISGNAGDDIIQGGLGNDEIYGDDGDDYLTGGNGVDFLDGGKGDDVIIGGLGADQIVGDDGSDSLFGGKGNDEIWGHRPLESNVNFSDYIFGGYDNDFLSGSSIDTLIGGPDNDIINSETRAAVLISGQSNACSRTLAPTEYFSTDWQLSNNSFLTSENIAPSTPIGFYGPEVPISSCPQFENYDHKYIGKLCRGGAPIDYFTRNIDELLVELNSIQSYVSPTHNYMLWVHGESASTSLENADAYQQEEAGFFEAIINQYPNIRIVSVLLASDIATSRPLYSNVNEAKVANSNFYPQVTTISSESYSKGDSIHYDLQGVNSMASDFCNLVVGN